MRMEWVTDSDLVASLKARWKTDALPFRHLLGGSIDAKAVRAQSTVEPEQGEPEPGLGVFLHWGIQAGEHPFGLMVSTRPPGHERLLLAAPTRLTPDGLRDLSPLFALGEAAEFLFRDLAFVDQLPFVGPGHGVFRQGAGGAEEGLYRSPHEEDAARLLAFLDGFSHEGTYLARPVPAAREQWILVETLDELPVGRVFDHRSLPNAKRMGQSYSASSAGAFTLYQGQIAPERVIYRYERGKKERAAPG